MSATDAVLVSTDWVRDHLDDSNVRIIEVDVDPKQYHAGHIPGAVNRPTGANLVSGAGFKSADALRAEFEALGVRDDVPVAVYCGSGVTAAHQIAALAIAGFDAVLYPGSWSQWSNHADRPVATGD